MNRSTLALALLATTGAASAQSSVTIYGVMDSAAAYGRGSLTSRKMLTSGANTTSRIGFRGTEDLGGGLSAGFVLEAQVFVDTGEGQPTNTNNQTTGTTTTPAGTQGLTFARRSTVSLTGQFGEVRLGRDFTAHYRNRVEVDPFGNAGVGASQAFVGSIGGVVSTRASNMIGYFLPPNLGGVYGQVQHYRGENPSGTPTSKDGTGNTLRLGYANGPVNVSVAYGHTSYNATATAGDITTQNIGVQYNLGFARLMGGLYRDKVKRLVPITAKGYAVGGVVPLGVGEIKLAYSQYGTDSGVLHPEVKKVSAGYVYNLSKRTALYGTLALVLNNGGATTALNLSTTAADAKSAGIDIGVRHLF
jgi:predicted porin